MLANVVVGLVALLHLYFLVLEMFLWDKLAGLRTDRRHVRGAAARRPGRVGWPGCAGGLPCECGRRRSWHSPAEPGNGA